MSGSTSSHSQGVETPICTEGRGRVAGSSQTPIRSPDTSAGSEAAQAFSKSTSGPFSSPILPSAGRPPDQGLRAKGLESKPNQEALISEKKTGSPEKYGNMSNVAQQVTESSFWAGHYAKIFLEIILFKNHNHEG